MIENSERLDLVLLIDDDELVNILNTILLRKSGIVDKVESANSGEKGLEILAQYERENKWPSLIFVDINMPGLTGWEFIEKFRERFSTFKQQCTICMLSSSLDPEDQEKAAKSDLVDFYLSKPLTIERVQTLVAKPI